MSRRLVALCLLLAVWPGAARAWLPDVLCAAAAELAAAAQPDQEGPEDDGPEEDEDDDDGPLPPPAMPLEEFLQSSPHPVLVSIAADYMVYASDRKLLYARGNVRYSGRGFLVAAEALRLDVATQRALLSGVRGSLRKGSEQRGFEGDVLRLDLARRRAVLVTYGERITSERLWFPEKTEEQPTTELSLYFHELENAPVESELGRILDAPFYLQLERVRIDPESRVRARGVVPVIEGQPGPRLPFFTFRTGDAAPREGLSLHSFGASNTAGIRGELLYALSPAERLLTTFQLRYEELSLLDDPFRPARRARFGAVQKLMLSDALDAELGGYYQTDAQWEGRVGFELQRGAHRASVAALLQNDPLTGRHDRLRAQHAYDREGLSSKLRLDADLGTQLDLRWEAASRLWNDRLSLQLSSSYLKRFERGLYQRAEVLSENAFATLTLPFFLTTLAYSGTQDLDRGQQTHYPSLTLETLPRSIGGGLLLSVGNQVRLSAISGPDFADTRIDDELWATVRHVPIFFTERLSYDVQVRLGQRLLEATSDETTLEARATLTRRIGQLSSTSLTYRYLTVRQSASEWLTAGSVVQEAQGVAQIRLDRTKTLFAQGRYSISEGAPLDAYLQFNGDFGLEWKASLRSGYDFKRERFSALDVSVARDLFFGWMRITYRQVQNELSVDYTAKLF
jgi:hypothetical protein